MRPIPAFFVTGLVAVLVTSAKASFGGSDEALKLLPSAGAAWDYFGHAVAIDGTTTILGAYQDDDNGTDSGSAYLFDTTTGLQLAQLLPSDGAAYDNFGNSVATSGTTAIVSLCNWDSYRTDTADGKVGR